MSDDQTPNAVELATDLTIAWLGNQNNRVAAEDVPAFLRTMHATITELGAGGSDDAVTASDEDAADNHVPAVSARKSLGSKDHIISMIDGKPYKTLRRHLVDAWADAGRVSPTLQSQARLSDGRAKPIRSSAARWRRRSASAKRAAPPKAAASLNPPDRHASAVRDSRAARADDYSPALSFSAASRSVHNAATMLRSCAIEAASASRSSLVIA